MSDAATLEIRGLEASVEDKPILKGIDLTVAATNSTCSSVISG